MVQYHRYHHQWRKGDKRIEEDEESQALIMECGSSGCYFKSKRTRPKLISLLFLSLLSCYFILAPHLFSPGSPFPLFCKSFSLSWVALVFHLVSSVFLCFLCFDVSFFVCADSFGVEKEGPVSDTPLCSSISNGWYFLSLYLSLSL